MLVSLALLCGCSFLQTWDESHSFAVHKSMHFAVIDSKGGDSNNLIGETTVTIAELRQLGGFDHDVRISWSMLL